MELPVGLFGIIELTLQIIHKNFKHFLCMAVLLALPYAVSLIVLYPSSVATQTFKLYKLIASVSELDELPSLPELSVYVESTFTQRRPLPSFLLLATLIFKIIVSDLVCRPLISFSVCRACLNQSLDLKGSLQGVRGSVMNLVLTALCEFAVLAVIVIVYVLVIAVRRPRLLVAVLSGYKAEETDIVMSILALVMVGIVVYAMVSFGLADSVAILEEKKGREALQRSLDLLSDKEGERKWLAFWLSSVFTLCLMLLPIAVSEAEASPLWRWSAAAVSVGLQAFIALLSMSAHVVFYMSCKSYRRESLHTLVAASAEFGPQESSADLETAVINTPLTALPSEH